MDFGWCEASMFVLLSGTFLSFRAKPVRTFIKKYEFELAVGVNATYRESNLI